MARTQYTNDSTAYERDHPAPAAHVTLAVAAAPLLALAALTHPLMAVLAVEAALLWATWRRL